MEKGHVEFGELFVIVLLLVGLATAVMLLTDGNLGVQASAAQEAPHKELSQSASAQEPASEDRPQDAPAYPATDLSVGELLDEGLARADSRFYNTDPDGDYEIRSYRWAMDKLDLAPDSIPLKENDFRASPVRFDGRYDDALRAFAFKTYQKPELRSPPQIYGTAVFLSSETPFDVYASGQEPFTITYDPHPERSQDIEGCVVISSSIMSTGSGAVFKVHDVSCKVMYTVNP
ncbi:MAG: hypothetical protein V1827_05440 [Candidatus Micrarchaeota archaeon]